ncbi:hypothetical protein GCM10010972_22440 [Cellulomonas carbonis]|uniref:tRNA-guanine transglycosylase n=2 Tax=Cellulomonas carbonis TaxID=1386092 RepID=A0A0A0BQD2_9CELL|nr:hypothetical protein [Cellulomonas carbonis]KGM10160.1 hypothetical protein N868_16500 [Cellulomonas carbonis T26]GGC08661.1 hypothetical protein GCM10010972_22440 [Cellulomonas carbonis]
MPKVTFVHNLKPDAVQAAVSGMSDPAGYLVAPGNATGQGLELTRFVRGLGFDLLVDNGNFALLGPIGRQFGVEARTLHEEVRTAERALGRTARGPGDLPADLSARYGDLADRVRRAAVDAVPADASLALAQDALDPTSVIGVEDLTMACWLRLDVEPAYLRRPRRAYRRMNRSVARRAVRAAAARGDPAAVPTLPVASALSFNTAKDAGREFAAAGLTSISMGFGAYMADDHFTDHLYRDRRRIDLGANLPQRYTRTVAAAVGFWEGYDEVAHRPPARFHFLGVGAPIMIALLALAARRTPELSFDATSPILDATQGGTIYSDRPAHLKLRTRKVAHRLAREPALTWDCPCPFCTDFTGRSPFDYARGHAWFATTGATDVTTADLAPGGALFEAYPLLSEPAAGELRREVSYARVGHNHWIIDRLARSLTRASARGTLPVRVTSIIRDYQARTTPVFARAVEVGLQLAAG